MHDHVRLPGNIKINYWNRCESRQTKTQITQNKIDKDNTQQNLLLTLNVDYRIKSSCQNIIPAKPDPGKLDLVENYHKRKFKIAKAQV